MTIYRFTAVLMYSLTISAVSLAQNMSAQSMHA